MKAKCTIQENIPRSLQYTTYTLGSQVNWGLPSQVEVQDNTNIFPSPLAVYWLMDGLAVTLYWPAYSIVYLLYCVSLITTPCTVNVISSCSIPCYHFRTYGPAHIKKLR